MLRSSSLSPVLSALALVVLAAAAGPGPGGIALAGQVPEPAFAAASPDDATRIQAQYRRECFFVYGIEEGTGNLYRVDLATGFGTRRSVSRIAAPAGRLDLTAPDGLAYDRLHDRLYFADAGAGGGSLLHYYDVMDDEFRTAGRLSGRVTGATFSEGAYHYVDERTDELRRVFLADDGSVRAESTVADFGLDEGLLVEDLAVLGQVLYGSTSSDGSGTVARFFAYDLRRGVFRTLSTSSATYLQLAFGNDRGLATLFGVSTDDAVFYEIDHGPMAGGASTSLVVETDVRFSDLAQGPVC